MRDYVNVGLVAVDIGSGDDASAGVHLVNFLLSYIAVRTRHSRGSKSPYFRTRTHNWIHDSEREFIWEYTVSRIQNESWFSLEIVS